MLNAVEKGKSKMGEQNSLMLFRMTGWTLTLITLSLPFFATIACIVISLIFDFKASTSTYCKGLNVYNFLPSISSAIGGFTPQKYIWRICIALHSTPRFLVAIIYRNHYKSFTPTRRNLYSKLVDLHFILNVIELSSLVTLTYVSSSENYHIHENSFIVFMVCSILYMILTCILFKWSRSSTKFSERDVFSFRCKVGFFLFNLSSFLIAVYFFFLHNAYCRHYAYSAFAFFEYLTVLSNMAFHTYTQKVDIGKVKLRIFDDWPRTD